MIGDTSVAEMIRAWKRARLSSDEHLLGYPSISIIAKFGLARSGRPAPLPEGERTDPEIIQGIVDIMPIEMRFCFEAFHLKLIKGTRCRALPHRARAYALGVSERTYRRRVKAGYRFITTWLDEVLT